MTYDKQTRHIAGHDYVREVTIQFLHKKYKELYLEEILEIVLYKEIYEYPQVYMEVYSISK